MDRILGFPAYIASIAPRNFEDARRLVSLVPEKASAIEYRLDLAGVRLSARALLDLDPRCAIATYRTAAEGGKFDGSREEYRKSVQSAFDAGATVDVELESGLLGDPSFLPDRRRVIGSKHGDFEFAEKLVDRLLETDVTAVKLVNRRLASFTDLFAALALMKETGRRRPVSFFTMGRAGMASRVLGRNFGSALVYGGVEAPTGDGQMSLGELFDVYRVDRPAAAERLFAVYGGDVSRSLSPLIHNTLFTRRQRADLYFPASSTLDDRVEKSNSVRELQDLLTAGEDLFGLSVTNPFKEAALRAARDAEESALAVGAANTLLREGGAAGESRFSARNTDTTAVFDALAAREATGMRMVILGAGGAASAAAYAGRTAGNEVCLVARDSRKGGAAASRLGVLSRPMCDLPELDAEILVNATPLGAAGDERAFPASLLEKRPVVLDFAYRPSGRTPLVAQALAAGCAVADGLEILARQAAGQARLFGVTDATFEEIMGILGAG